MIKYFFLFIVIYIIFKQFYDNVFYYQKCAYTKSINNKKINNNNTKTNNNKNNNNDNNDNNDNNNENDNKKEILFDKPNPWTKILYLDEYNLYFIKIKIPSLNDYQTWKNIVSELNFDPKTGELIIPSNSENTALAIANLIIMNLMGQITLKDIIDKNLIDISISKANNHTMIKEKIRQQIMNNLYNNNDKISNNEKHINNSNDDNDDNDNHVNYNSCSNSNVDNNVDAFNSEYDISNNFSFI